MPVPTKLRHKKRQCLPGGELANLCSVLRCMDPAEVPWVDRHDVRQFAASC